jgi:hypothetical protein
MAKAFATSAEPTPLDGLAPLFALPALWAENMFRLHKLQLDACLSWQQAVAATGQEFYDEWACRFAGGAPIDA